MDPSKRSPLKYAQAIALPFTMIAAICGIYFVEKPPYTHIAAVAVVLGTGIAFVDALKTAKEKEYAEEMLTHVAGSVPPSRLWRDCVRAMVSEAARKKGYALVKALATKTDFYHPDADTLFLFQSTNHAECGLKGALVLTPADYVKLAALGKGKVSKLLRQLLFGQWDEEYIKDDVSLEDFADRFGQTQAALYSLARWGENFKVSVKQPNEGSLEVVTGDVRLSFDRAQLNELLSKPPLVRTLTIAETIARTEPKLLKYLKT